jgi:AraC-like DNA-binding protein
MSYKEIHYSRNTENFIDCEWSLQAERSEELVHPDGCADLVFDESGRIYISGVAPRTRPLDQTISIVLNGLRLRPGAIPFFFGVPAWEFSNRVTCTTSVSSPLARAMTAIAHQADSRAELLRTIVKLLFEKGSAARPQSRLAFAFDQAEWKPVAAVARALGMSERHLHRLFLDQVGLSPSKFRRIRRLQRVIDAMRRLPPNPAMASFALDHGFFDQAHLNHELMDLTGMSPGALHRSVAGR